MSVFQERLNLFVEARFEGNLSRFARAVDISTAQIDSYRRQGRILPHKYRDAIEATGLSWRWYETGEGAMFTEAVSRESNVGDVHEAYDFVIKHLSDLTVNEIKELSKQINEVFESVI